MSARIGIVWAWHVGQMLTRLAVVHGHVGPAHRPDDRAELERGLLDGDVHGEPIAREALQLGGEVAPAHGGWD